MNNLFYTGESQSSKKEGIIALKQGRLSVGFSLSKRKYNVKQWWYYFF
jgi:hypothetical protein